MKIAIIGAGIGGVLAVQEIKKRIPKAKITLIDNNKFFVFTPRLTEVMSEMVHEKWIVTPLEVFESSKVHVILAKATNVDFKKKIIQLSNKEKVRYDYLIFAQGAKTNFFGLEVAKKNAMQFKDYEDAEKVKDRIKKAFSQINYGKKKNFKIALIGGGPTGTELAFAIRDYTKQHKKDYPKLDEKNIKITIYQSPKTLVPDFDERIIKIAHKEAERENIEIKSNHRVVDIKKNKLYFKEGKPESADLIIWMTGVTPNVIPCVPELKLERGAIPVKKTLQLKNHNNVFAIGDCNYSLDPKSKPYAPTAQNANQQAIHLSKNLKLLIDKKPLKDFNYKTRGVFLSLGYCKTAAQAFSFVFDGYLAWLMRDQYYKHIFRQLTKS